ncbi:MAG: hypothetical protein KC910_34560 [Candidatus Eremiobacteraeota bacterium]|nr:hypothetical protein [Candidatus Eremiobacteraeota bacterium]
MIYTLGAGSEETPLARSSIEVLVDLRPLPARPPAGLVTVKIAALRGGRAARPDSSNTVWAEGPLRGYADHMQSDEFAGGVAQLLKLVRQRKVGLLGEDCPWFVCVRGMLADYLRARHDLVANHLCGDEVQPHPYTVAARTNQGNYTRVVLQLKR